MYQNIFIIIIIFEDGIFNCNLDLCEKKLEGMILLLSFVSD